MSLDSVKAGTSDKAQSEQRILCYPLFVRPTTPLVFWFSDLPLACSEIGTKLTFSSDSLPCVLGFAVPSGRGSRSNVLWALLWALVTNRSIEEYLFWAKQQEENRDYYLDIALALSTVYWADKGIQKPDIYAYYNLVGIHPDKYSEKLKARRIALFGEELYNAWFGAGAVSPFASDPSLPPKKPAVPSPEVKKVAA